MINCIKSFFQINKYTTTKLSIINGMANKLVAEIRACMVEDFSLKPRQTEVDRVSQFRSKGNISGGGHASAGGVSH